jgi:hypothetical protein
MFQRHGGGFMLYRVQSCVLLASTPLYIYSERERAREGGREGRRERGREGEIDR